VIACGDTEARTPAEFNAGAANGDRAVVLGNIVDPSAPVCDCPTSSIGCRLDMDRATSGRVIEASPWPVESAVAENKRLHRRLEHLGLKTGDPASRAAGAKGRVDIERRTLIIGQGPGRIGEGNALRHYPCDPGSDGRVEQMARADLAHVRSPLDGFSYFRRLEPWRKIGQLVDNDGWLDGCHAAVQATFVKDVDNDRLNAEGPEDALIA
jgi:hypothetical protein